MTFMQCLTRKTPLENERDLMARIGVRCVWCTLPYFALALGLAAFGEMRPLLTPASAIALAVPLAGAVLDWRRLQLRTNVREATA